MLALAPKFKKMKISNNKNTTPLNKLLAASKLSHNSLSKSTPTRSSSRPSLTLLMRLR